MTVRDAYYTVALHGGREQFTIDTKYKIIRKVGSGSYGIVCSAIDLTNNNGTWEPFLLFALLTYNCIVL